MRILGIETSCDETAAAIVENGTEVISNIVASSSEMHAKTGGVIPEQAARQQIVSILPVISEASKSKTFDAIAVTVGPGLIGSLLVGVETAKTLAYLSKKPIVPVNHLTAHVYSNWISENPPVFPALALVVSGGHTDLVLMKNHEKILWIGGTRDDAAGEAFDKTARLLQLPYPGGPSIAKEANKYLSRLHNPQLRMFPRPMINKNNFDFSFSGLKTAVLRGVNTQQRVSKQRLAAEIQEAIVDVLVRKALDAVKKIKPKSLLLAGGVSANSRLREKFKKTIKSQSLIIDLRFPPEILCTDNAACIASYAYFNFKPLPWNRITANAELTITDKA